MRQQLQPIFSILVHKCLLMKNKILLLLILFMMNKLAVLSQDTLSVPPAPADSAVVYFVRTSSLGFAINFTYFDSAEVIAKCNGANYVRYVCTPGRHLLWGRSENKDFIEAELEAGKIYFIEATPLIGFIKAQIEIKPVDPMDKKVMKRIIKLLNKKQPETFTKEQLEKETVEFKDVIERGLDKYKEEKESGDKIKQLEKEKHL